jgi:DNA-binding transcriptional LysR family regulator
MLGIGNYSSALEEEEQEEVSTRLLIRSPVGIVCPKHRRFPKRGVPKLKDFRHDKFLSVHPELAFGYEQWLRGFCKRFGGFEPEIAASANSPDTLIGMVAAGGGVFVGAEVAVCGRQAVLRSVGDYYLFTEPGSHFELFVIWKRQTRVEKIISQFIDVLVAELESPTSPS